jgi:hypothetical protein
MPKIKIKELPSKIKILSVKKDSLEESINNKTDVFQDNSQSNFSHSGLNTGGLKSNEQIPESETAVRANRNNKIEEQAPLYDTGRRETMDTRNKYDTTIKSNVALERTNQVSQINTRSSGTSSGVLRPVNQSGIIGNDNSDNPLMSNEGREYREGTVKSTKRRSEMF